MHLEEVLRKRLYFGVEDEDHSFPPPMLSHQSPTFINTLLDSSPHYDRFRKKRPALSATVLLRCEWQPLFKVSLIFLRTSNRFMMNIFLAKGTSFVSVLLVL